MTDTISNPIIIISNRGFIGRNIFQYLKKTNHYTLGFSSDECNLLSLSSINECMSVHSEEATIIITSAITRLKDNTIESFFKNMQMIKNLVTILEEKPIKKIIFLSTIDVYDCITENEQISEKTPINPADYYSLSKYVNEFIVRDFCVKNEIPYQIIRLSGVFGPYDEGKSTINKFVSSAFNEGVITIFGGGNDIRDFVYVNDLCRFIEKYINDNSSMTVNFASGISYSINQLVQIIADLSPLHVDVIYKEQTSPPSRQKNLQFDQSFFKEKYSDFNFTSIYEAISVYIYDYGKLMNSIQSPNDNCGTLN